MKERQPLVAETEARLSREAVANVLSFGSVDDMIEELVARPPDGNVVRLDSYLRDEDGGDRGLRLRTASVLLTARRIDELLVANLVHSYYRAFYNQPLLPRDWQLSLDNDRLVTRVLEAQLRERGFLVGRGAYALPENLMLYQASSSRLLFKERQAIASGELAATQSAAPARAGGGARL